MSLSFILASQSPRRKELLAQLGYEFTVASADIDEQVNSGEIPEHYVARLALEKAKVIAGQQPDDVAVLGSDTAVVVDQQILGKPENEKDFQRMMQLLSGRKHHVLTAIAVVVKRNGQSEQHCEVVCTEVQFTALTDNDIHNYWLTGEPQDKAGGYGIQGIGGQFITRIEGSYSAVVGLPLVETAAMLKSLPLAGRLI